MRAYDRRTVEVLLPTLWDRDSVWGVTSDIEIDRTMPRAKANPAHGFTLPAMMADIQQAWKYAPLKIKERRALLLAYGMGWTHEEIGYNQGVTRRGAGLRIERGVGRITNWLNGDDDDDVQMKQEVEND